MKFILTMLLVFSAGISHGAEFNQVQLKQSSISFVSRQMNVPVAGSFKQFSAQIAFDPAKPDTGKAQIEIELASIETGSNEGNDEVKGKSWFNMVEFPKARFISNSVKALGAGRFEASGRMTIKGKALEVRAPFTATVEKGSLVIDGVFPLKRLAFGIGTGVWSDTATVADEVQVGFHFVIHSR